MSVTVQVFLNDVEMCPGTKRFALQKRRHFIIQSRTLNNPELEARSAIADFSQDPKPGTETKTFDENPGNLNAF